MTFPLSAALVYSPKKRSQCPARAFKSSSVHERKLYMVTYSLPSASTGIKEREDIFKKGEILLFEGYVNLNYICVYTHTHTLVYIRNTFICHLFQFFVLLLFFLLRRKKKKGRDRTFDTAHEEHGWKVDNFQRRRLATRTHVIGESPTNATWTTLAGNCRESHMYVTTPWQP